ncbi:transcriptional regulator [Microtetraspora sp. NBRC 13810]|uniref:helix-turn-helix domain-containing protein n=1 Tax=Microtetraspora sp. NBRC 13810 TaxID=3030990 RepID=UPI0024A0E290|nr:helix-turn-helix transcriptional regulator [Microtetraspora sp. NBRC 13810]GLW09221.1 transcriptional regulator [Microtetraspora sp. NBRC 13810]
MPQPEKPLEPGRSARHWFGAELRRLRHERGWRQGQLAEKVHVSAGLIGKIERASRRCADDLAPMLDEALGSDGVLTRALDQVRSEEDRAQPQGDRKSVPGVPEVTQAPPGPPPWHASRACTGPDPVAAVFPVALRHLVRQIDPVPMPRAIGPQEIDQLHGAAATVSGWDNHFGGAGMVRQTASAQLQWAAGLLRIPCPSSLRPALYAAVARLGMVVGASAFDAYAHHDARHAFTVATLCAEEAGEWHLRAKIYSFRSRQATWLGDPDAGLTYAELGLARADRLTATERAMLLVAKARALAKMQRCRETVAAVGAADEAFALARPAGDPPWMRYYDNAQHHGDTGHALYDLVLGGGDATSAGARLTTAVHGHGDDFARSRAMSRIKLACLMMVAGDPHEAADTGRIALGEVGRLRSRRAADDLRELAALGARHLAVPAVADLCRRIAGTARQ